jgi:hypothetical protein
MDLLAPACVLVCRACYRIRDRSGGPALVWTRPNAAAHPGFAVRTLLDRRRRDAEQVITWLARSKIWQATVPRDSQ